MSTAVRRLAAIALLGASFVLAVVVIRYQPLVEHLIRSYYPFAVPLAIGVFALVASAPFSVTDALAVMNGAIFGPIRGTIIDAIGLVLAGLLGYWINRHASRLLDLDSYLQRLPAWVKRFPVGSPGFLIAVRIIPGFGGTVATATAATFRVPVWVHVWTMCAVAIPVCAILSIFGNQVTIYVHRYEARARTYLEHHHPHFNFHFRHRVPPTSQP
ncbi:MAG TPA: VTT domain-containing protein [Candidatus Dormibacteraeota bacterium]|nr:VTT domain-containing protein [Candidatus Dormibacteraeota bacterium]